MIFEHIRELKKIKHKEKMESARLLETREMADLWRKSIGRTTPYGCVIMEQICFLSLCIEWGHDSLIFFDYDAQKIKCEKNDIVMFI